MNIPEGQQAYLFIATLQKPDGNGGSLVVTAHDLSYGPLDEEVHYARSMRRLLALHGGWTILNIENRALEGVYLPPEIAPSPPVVDPPGVVRPVIASSPVDETQRPGTAALTE